MARYEVMLEVSARMVEIVEEPNRTAALLAAKVSARKRLLVPMGIPPERSGQIDFTDWEVSEVRS